MGKQQFCNILLFVIISLFVLLIGAEVQAQTITVSGNAYEDETSSALTSCDGTTNMISLRVGGTTYGPVSCADASGVFSLTNVTQPSAGDPMVIWIDGVASNFGSNINRYSGTGNVTGIVLRRNRVIAQHDDSGPVTNSDMNTWDNSNDSDINYNVVSEEDWSTSYDAGRAIYSLTFDSANNVIYAGIHTYGIIYRCDTSTLCDEDSDWTVSYDTTEDDIYSLTFDSTNNVIYAGSADGGIIYRCDTSTSCDEASDWSTSYDTPGSYIESLTFDSTNNVIYAGENWDRKIYRCDTSTFCDAAGDWTSYDYPSTIYSLTFDSTNNVIYAGTSNNGIIYRCDTSTLCDATGDWSTSYDTTEIRIYSLTFDSTNNVIYAGTNPNGIIYRCDTSTLCNEASDWTVSYDTTDSQIRSLTFDSTDNVIYAGGGKIYRCDTSTLCDAAGDWTVSYNAFVYSLTFDSTNNVIYAGSSGGIIYRTTIIMNLTVEAGSKLIVNTSDTFTPGGEVTITAASVAANPDGDLLISPGATLNIEAYNLSVGGDYLNSGTFTKSSGQATTFTATGTGFSITPGTGNFEDIIFNGTGGGWSFSAAVIIDNDLTITAGSLSGTGNITVSGDLTMTAGTLSGTSNVTVNGGGVTGDGTINFTTGTFSLDGAGNFGGATNWTFYNLTIGGDGNAETTAATGAGGITISNILTIGANQTLDAGSKTWTLSDSATPFVINGTFTANSSTFNYTATTAATITATTYYNLGVGTSADATATTYTLGGNTTVSNVLTVGNASSVAFDTLAGSSYTLTLSNSGTPFVITDYGSFSADTSTFKYTASATITATTYYNLELVPNSLNWTTSYDTTETAIYALTFDSTNNVIYAGSSGGIIYRCDTSTLCDAAGDWTVSYDTTESSISSLTFDSTNNVIYAGSGSGGIIYRCDTSTSCDAAGDWTVSYDTTQSYIYSLTLDSANNVIYAGTGYNGIIYRCDTSTLCDAAGDWTTSYDTTESDIYSLTFDSTNNIIYAGSGSGGIIYRCDTSTSCDAAGDWTVSYDTTEKKISSLIFDSTNNIIYAGTYPNEGYNGIIYRCDTSTLCDAAGDWTVSHDATVSYIDSLTFDSTNNIIYAGGWGGMIYRCDTSTSCDATGDWSTSYDATEPRIDSLIFDSTNNIIYAGTWAGGVIYRGSISLYTLGDAASQTINANGYLTIGDGTNLVTVNAATYDPNLNIDGNLTISAKATLIASDSSSFSVAGNWANSGAFTHSSGTITFDGSAQQTLSGTMTGSSAFYNLVITNNSGTDPDTDPSIIFSASTTANTATFSTASTKVRFQAGSTYTFTNINWNGQATTTRVQLRSSASPTQWNLVISGTQTVLNVNPKDSNACSGNTIDATDTTNLNSGNNNCWTFFTLSASSVSDSLDPVIIGGVVTFTGSWSEPDAGEQNKMYICKDSSCTNCNDTSQANCWCYSSAWQTEPDLSDTCNYTTSGSDIGDNSYWLGVCDDSNNCDPTPLSGGTFTVSLASTGGGGLPSEAYMPPFPPKEGFSLLINNGDEYTSKREVTLKLNGSPDAKRMAISEKADFSEAGQEPYTSTITWILSKSDGLKTIYAKFYTQWGQSSSVVFDSIILKILPEKPVTAMTIEELKVEIARIATLIAQLQAQLAELLAVPVVEGIPAGFTFERNLKYGMTSDEIKYLQILLKEEVGPPTYPENISAIGWFGPITKVSVIEFQEKYSEDILAPWGISEGTGFVGKTTRAKINEILGR